MSPNTDGHYFNIEVRHPGNHASVKITAPSNSGPFTVRKYTQYANRYSGESAVLKTIKAAYKWAEDHLGIVVSEVEIDTVNNRRRRLTAPTAQPDRIFTEDDFNL